MIEATIKGKYVNKLCRKKWELFIKWKSVYVSSNEWERQMGKGNSIPLYFMGADIDTHKYDKYTHILIKFLIIKISQ